MGTLEHVREVFRSPDERVFEELRYLDKEELHAEAEEHTRYQRQPRKLNLPVHPGPSQPLEQLQVPAVILP